MAANLVDLIPNDGGVQVAISTRRAGGKPGRQSRGEMRKHWEREIVIKMILTEKRVSYQQNSELGLCLHREKYLFQTNKFC